MSLVSRMRGIAVLPVMLLAAGGGVMAESWNLAGYEKLDLHGTSGDIVVRAGSPSIEVEYDVTPRDAFRVEVEEHGTTLRVEEVWEGTASGEVKWTIYVSAGAPALQIQTASGSLESRGTDLEIDFRTASGDIDLDNVALGRGSTFNTASGNFALQNMTAREGSEFHTASGDVELDRVTVEPGAEFSTASGNVEARNVTGELSLSSASGDVILSDSTLQGEGNFASASGNVSVSLDQLPAEGLSASSASGNVDFDAGRVGGNYTLILTADQRNGRIETPFRIASQRVYERNGREYVEQRVERGSGGPEVHLSTGSGTVKVRN